MNTAIKMGKYSLLNKIATGGMAEIYMAHNHMSGELKKLVAIKRVLPHFCNDQEFVGMFKDEARVLLKLDHKNIVTITDFGTHQSQLYLVMEYIHGKSIQDLYLHLLRRREKIPLQIALLIAREIAQGLHYLHSFQDYSTNEKFQVVHRDISPNNIMLGFGGQVKIIDFGIAKSVQQVEITRNGTIKGKYGYMSPEQALGKYVDHRTDIFSLGVLLWEMIANRKLIGGNPELYPLYNYKDFKAPNFKDCKLKIPYQIERIVKKSLEPIVQDRYTDISEMLRDLNLVINFLYPDTSEIDLSKFMHTSFASELNGDSELNLHKLNDQDTSERTELISGENTLSKSESNTSSLSMDPNRGRPFIYKFRNQVRIRLQKSGAEL